MPEQDQKPGAPSYEEMMATYDRAYNNLKTELEKTSPSIRDYIELGLIGDEIGVNLHRLGNHKRALDVFELALTALDNAVELASQNPHSPEFDAAHYGRGVLYLRIADQENFFATIDEDRELIQRDSQNAICDLTTALNNTELENIQLISRIHLGLAQAKIIYAKACNPKTKRDEAIKMLEDARNELNQCHIQETEFDVIASQCEIDMTVGQLYANNGQYDEALTCFNRANKLFDDAFFRFGYAIVEIYSNKGVIHKAIAGIYRKTNCESKALNEYQKAIYAYSQLLRLQPFRAYDYHRRGHLYSDTGDNSKALSDYIHAVQYAPETIEYRLDLARQYKNMGLKQEALDQYSIILKQAPNQQNLWEEVIRIIAETHAIDTENQAVEKQSEEIAKEYALVADIMWMCELPEHPGEDQLYYGLRDEIHDAFSYHLLIAKGQAPPPETYVHRLTKYITFAGPLLIPDTLTSGIASALLEKASGDVLHSVDRWNQHKSQHVVAALNHMEGEATSIEEKMEEIAKTISEQLTQEYGYSVELLKLNKLGLTALVSTMIERMILGMANNPELLKEIEDGRIDPVDACIRCVKEGKTNYPVRSLDAVMYDARDIIAGQYAEE